MKVVLLELVSAQSAPTLMMVILLETTCVLVVELMVMLVDVPLLVVVRSKVASSVQIGCRGQSRMRAMSSMSSWCLRWVQMGCRGRVLIVTRIHAVCRDCYRSGRW